MKVQFSLEDFDKIKPYSYILYSPNYGEDKDYSDKRQLILFKNSLNVLINKCCSLKKLDELEDLVSSQAPLVSQGIVDHFVDEIKQLNDDATPEDYYAIAKSFSLKVINQLILNDNFMLLDGSVKCAINRAHIGHIADFVGQISQQNLDKDHIQDRLLFAPTYKLLALFAFASYDMYIEEAEDELSYCVGKQVEFEAARGRAADKPRPQATKISKDKDKEKGKVVQKVQAKPAQVQQVQVQQAPAAVQQALQQSVQYVQYPQFQPQLYPPIYAQPVVGQPMPVQPVQQMFAPRPAPQVVLAHLQQLCTLFPGGCPKVFEQSQFDSDSVKMFKFVVRSLYARTVPFLDVATALQWAGVNEAVRGVLEQYHQGQKPEGDILNIFRTEALRYLGDTETQIMGFCSVDNKAQILSNINQLKLFASEVIGGAENRCKVFLPISSVLYLNGFLLDMSEFQAVQHVLGQQSANWNIFVNQKIDGLNGFIPPADDRKLKGEQNMDSGMKINLNAQVGQQKILQITEKEIDGTKQQNVETNVWQAPLAPTRAFKFSTQPEPDIKALQNQEKNVGNLETQIEFEIPQAEYKRIRMNLIEFPNGTGQKLISKIGNLIGGGSASLDGQDIVVTVGEGEVEAVINKLKWVKINGKQVDCKVE